MTGPIYIRPQGYLRWCRLAELGGERHTAFAQQIEAGEFDPWIAHAEHRPLGEIMRARRTAYFASQQSRGAVGG